MAEILMNLERGSILYYLEYADKKLNAILNSTGSVAYFWSEQILRSLVFLATILIHGFRRLLPPY